MNAYTACLLFFVTLVLSGHAYAKKDVDSLYTDLDGKACTKYVDDESTGAHTIKCPGVGGYRLHVMEDDERSSVSVVTPDNRVFHLDYWDVVTRGFSSLGKKAEWRVTKVGGKTVPIALIVRVNAVDQSDLDHPRRVPLLAVAQIRRDVICVVTKLDAAHSTANLQARRFADGEARECLTSDVVPNNSTKG